MIKVIERREKDIESMRNLFFKTRVTTFSWNDTSQFKLYDFDKETENEYILVALADDDLIGFVSVWAADNFIHHLYVDEKFQNQGIGTLLLNAVLDKFSHQVRLKCDERNKKAIYFYRQKGFSEIETGQSESGTYILFEFNRKTE
jgi:GNAT superfamily N-acetyltransferase